MKTITEVAREYLEFGLTVDRGFIIINNPVPPTNTIYIYKYDNSINTRDVANSIMHDNEYSVGILGISEFNGVG